VIVDDHEAWIEDEVDVCAPDDPFPLEFTDDEVEVDAWAPDDPAPVPPESTEDDVPVDACAPDVPDPVPPASAEDDVPVEASAPGDPVVAPPALADEAVDVCAPDAPPLPLPSAFAEDDVEVEAAAPPWFPAAPGAGDVPPVVVLACPLEPSDDVLVVAPAGAPDALAAVLVCPDELGVVVVGVDPVEVVAVVPVDPEFDEAWPEFAPDPVVDEVDEVDVGPLVAELELDPEEGAGRVVVEAELVVLPATAEPGLVDADDTAEGGGAGLLFAVVVDALCVLEDPPLTFGWTVIDG
jgi:hypothetical protein